MSGIITSEEGGRNQTLIFQGRKSTENGIVGNTDESKARGVNILLRDVETMTEEEQQKP